MSFAIEEIVRSGNTTARVKNYYPETGLLVLYDIQGTLETGMTVVGDDSGVSTTLDNFVIADEYDLGYEPTNWTDILDSVIYDGNGNLVAQEEHFTGKSSQDYQTTFMVVQE
jgi:hypothetical protein